MIVTFGPLIFISIETCDAGALATVFGKWNGGAASGDSRISTFRNSVSAPAPAEPVPIAIPIPSRSAATSKPASATACWQAISANWLPRSRRRAFIAGISGCGEKPSYRAAWVACRSPR